MTSRIQIGQTVPEGTFLHVPWTAELEDSMVCGTPTKLSTNEWKGKKVVVCSVVGAFTGTCHAQIPAYVQNVKALKAKGVDVIAVITANDPFVLSGWQRVQGVKDEILFLSDGYAKWSQALGLAVDLTAAGLGERTGRWVLVLDDLKVTSLDVEDNPGKVTLTAADKVLEKL